MAHCVCPLSLDQVPTQTLVIIAYRSDKLHPQILDNNRTETSAAHSGFLQKIANAVIERTLVCT